MKTENILKQIAVSPTSRAKEQIKTLIDIFTMLKGLKSQITNIKREPVEMLIGKKSGWTRWGENVIQKGQNVAGESWTIQTTTGTYKQTIPTNNDLFRLYCTTFGQAIEQAKPLFEIDLNKKQAQSLRRLAAIVSKDKFKEALQYIKFELGAGELVAVATDGIRLSKLKLDFALDPFKGFEGVYFIDPNAIKADAMKLQFFASHYIANSITYDRKEFEYPDYQELFTTSSNDSVTVDRSNLVRAVKMLQPCCHKITQRMSFYFNGCIQINAEDLDFNNESSAKVQYQAKQGDDFTTAFNAKYLLQTLEAIDSKTVTITKSVRGHGFIFNDSALLMAVQ